MEAFFTMSHVNLDDLSVEVNSDGHNLFFNENQSAFDPDLDLASFLKTEFLATESIENISREPVNSFGKRRSISMKISLLVQAR